ncbi:KptA family-domain-containing protein [Mycena pura]|uniref:2'-phosphotransferase n=1 Tax=Mycena pura TaxID=153505 RepID=A0AAD6YEB8_9AGAR|nr:KptA family-domain-containing protein [Mycena pura]
MEQSSATAPEKGSRKKPAKPKAENTQAQAGSANSPKGNQQRSNKLRGHPRDSPRDRLSKTLSWILRHGALSEGLVVRSDGFVKVVDLLANPRLESLDLDALQEIVKTDSKQRYALILEGGAEPESATWWIKANQGHTIKAPSVVLDLQPILSVSDIPTGVAIHGTTRKAWESISYLALATQGLSKMARNHIHLAQGIVGENVMSGMRKSSQILIFIDVQRAIDDGVNFFLSSNGVILTEGNEQGILGTKYFARVETSNRVSVPGWEGVQNV